MGLVDIDVLREMLGRDPDFDGDEFYLVTDLAIKVREGADLEVVKQRLQQKLPKEVGGTVQTWQDQNRKILDAVALERGMMKVVLFVVMLVAAFLIYATLNMMVTQKTKDIGILTSMGNSQELLARSLLPFCPSHRSMPAPPNMMSLASPPYIRSFPSPPYNWSGPAPPRIRSSPRPPARKSLPGPPIKKSLEFRPMMISSPGPPSITSAPRPPTIQSSPPNPNMTKSPLDTLQSMKSAKGVPMTMRPFT